MVTLMEEIKHINMENTISKSEMNYFYLNFRENLDYQDFEAMININGTSNDSSSKGVKILMTPC